MPTVLKPNQRGPWCSFCEPKTTRATHVHIGWHPRLFACHKHYYKLAKVEETDKEMTEADYQTWGKL